MPGRYELVVARRFYKDLRQIDAQNQESILDALRQIKQDPHRGRKVIVAETGQYRWRVGPYRMRYDIKAKKIHILRLRQRRNAY